MCKESYKIINKYGDISYFKNGTKSENYIYHRTDGPAHERRNGFKSWCIDGHYHRENGPAVIYSDGTKEFWLNDEIYSEEDYWVEIKKFRKQKIKDL